MCGNLRQIWLRPPVCDDKNMPIAPLAQRSVLSQAMESLFGTEITVGGVASPAAPSASHCSTVRLPHDPNEDAASGGGW